MKWFPYSYFQLYFKNNSWWKFTEEIDPLQGDNLFELQPMARKSFLIPRIPGTYINNLRRLKSSAHLNTNNSV